MSKQAVAESAPTMIIPSGTQIEVDVHGQLSIRTPGNLVIQNSGNYGTIESVEGSIRIEPDVQVEAVNIKCAKVCYIQGSLTAWKVEAHSIELEHSARAHIILQETDRLQVGREARLVGNFSSEKELFLLFSRFAKQMRSMPFGLGRAEPLEIEQSEAGRLPAGTPEPVDEPAAATTNGSTSVATGEHEAPLDEQPTAQADELSDPLFFALVLLERELERPGHGPTAQRAIAEVVRLLKERDFDVLGRSAGNLFGQVARPSDDVVRARELIADHYRD